MHDAFVDVRPPTPAEAAEEEAGAPEAAAAAAAAACEVALSAPTSHSTMKSIRKTSIVSSLTLAWDAHAPTRMASESTRERTGSRALACTRAACRRSASGRSRLCGRRSSSASAIDESRVASGRSICEKASNSCSTRFHSARSCGAQLGPMVITSSRSSASSGRSVLRFSSRRHTTAKRV